MPHRWGLRRSPEPRSGFEQTPVDHFNFPRGGRGSSAVDHVPWHGKRDPLTSTAKRGAPPPPTSTSSEEARLSPQLWSGLAQPRGGRKETGKMVLYICRVRDGRWTTGTPANKLEIDNDFFFIFFFFFYFVFYIERGGRTETRPRKTWDEALGGQFSETFGARKNFYKRKSRANEGIEVRKDSMGRQKACTQAPKQVFCFRTVTAHACSSIGEGGTWPPGVIDSQKTTTRRLNTESSQNKRSGPKKLTGRFSCRKGGGSD